MSRLIRCFPLPLLLLAVAACGPSGVITVTEPVDTITARVVNGQETNDYPEVGKLTNNSSLCTATLIGQKTVLTAAHCISSPNGYYFKTNDGQSYSVVAAKRHPQYGNGYSNDLAVVTLAEAPPVQPAAIAISAPAANAEVIIVGYGKTSEYANDAGTKRMAKNKIAELRQTIIHIEGSSGGNGNICNGDSGGPSFAMVEGHLVQVGIHSTKGGACGTSGNDTRVDAYAQWIQDTANGDVQLPGPRDEGPPQVAIASPSALSWVKPNVNVVATAEDDLGVVKADLEVDGTVVASLAAPPYSFTATLPLGPTILKVVAYDEAGKRGEALVSVTVSETAPPAPDPEPAPTPDPDPSPEPGGGAPDPAPAPAPEPGAFGAPCAGAEDCSSALCARDPAHPTDYCTQPCGPTAPCPGGAACFNTDSPDLQVCGPPQGSTPDGSAPGTPGGGGNGLESQVLGCQMSLGGGAPSAVPLLLLGLLVLVRRRGRTTRA